MSEIHFAVSSSYTKEQVKKLENEGFYVISGQSIMTRQESNNNLVPIVEINEVSPRLGSEKEILSTIDVNFTALLYNLGVAGWENSKVYRPVRNNQQRSQRQLGNAHLRLRLSVSQSKEDPLKLWYPFMYKWWRRVRKNLGGEGNRPNGVQYRESSEPLVFNWNKTELCFSVNFEKQNSANGEYYPAELLQIGGFPPEIAKLGGFRKAPKLKENSQASKLMKEAEELYGDNAAAPNPNTDSEESEENEAVVEEQPF